jgi:hypothetical protein
LRDSIIYTLLIFALFYQIFIKKNSKIFYLIIFFIGFLIPQQLFLLINPILSLTIVLLFLFYLRPFYALSNMPYTEFLENFDYWVEVFNNFILSINGINPLSKAYFYLSNSKYYEYFLLFLPQ